ncbi:MAG: ASCH domain-containing protein, partial [Rhodospirillales bacterium]|nr:ASCH domain-containing protein [Rhodospirillales bacterium]
MTVVDTGSLLSIHVAILKPKYIAMMLDGRKTIESRFMKVRMPPLDCLRKGERLFIKASAGPFMATAIANHVEQFENLTHERFDALHKRYIKQIGGEPAYWQSKRNARFAVLAHLGDVEPLDVGPTYAKNGWRAWHVLDDAASPLLDVTLSDGAIRNRYVRVPAMWAGTRTQSFELLLPDGKRVETSVDQRGMIRWRGWSKYFDAAHVEAGDVVRLVQMMTMKSR